MEAASCCAPGPAFRKPSGPIPPASSASVGRCNSPTSCWPRKPGSGPCAFCFILMPTTNVMGPNGGATYGRLLELCTRRKEISPRVLKTVLALLSLTGFVETRRSDTDRRLKFYRPTARMLAYAKQRIALALEALDIAQPEIRRMQMLQDNPDLIRQVLASADASISAARPLADRMPDFMSFFGGREGAAPIVYTIMLADIDDTVPPSRAEMARRYALSKSQVSNVIAQGEALGYFALDAAGAPSATPHLRDHFAR